MIKIFLTVRNRLAITKKCVEALKRHSKIEHQIYVYNNQTNFLLKEHFDYFYELYRDKKIANLNFTSSESNFNAFSKAVTCNLFGKQHQQDPKKDEIFFLVFLDNDMIVTPGWDEQIRATWKYIFKNKFNHIKVISQVPGGIKNIKEKHKIDEKTDGLSGELGGSGLWAVKTDFFDEVGFLDIKRLINQNKRHDQLYWLKLQEVSKGKPYILGLKSKLAFHCGSISGSVCNTLTRNRTLKNCEELITFKDQEEIIDNMTFEEFYKKISTDEKIKNGW